MEDTLELPIEKMREIEGATQKALREFLRVHDKSQDEEGKKNAEQLADRFESQNKNLNESLQTKGQSNDGIQETSDLLAGMQKTLANIAETYGVPDEVTQNTLKEYSNYLKEMIEGSEAFLAAQTVGQLNESGTKTYNLTMEMLNNMKSLQAQVEKMTIPEAQAQNAQAQTNKQEQFAEAAELAKKNEQALKDATQNPKTEAATPTSKRMGDGGSNFSNEKSSEEKPENNGESTSTAESPSEPLRDKNYNPIQDPQVQKGGLKSQGKQIAAKQEQKESGIRAGVLKMLKAVGLSDEDAKKHVEGLSDSVAQGAAAALRGEIVSKNQATLQQNHLEAHQETLAKKEGKDMSVASALGKALGEVEMLGAKLGGLALGSLVHIGNENSAQLGAATQGGSKQLQQEGISQSTLTPR